MPVYPGIGTSARTGSELLARTANGCELPVFNTSGSFPSGVEEALGPILMSCRSGREGRFPLAELVPCPKPLCTPKAAIAMHNQMAFFSTDNNIYYFCMV